MTGSVRTFLVALVLGLLALLFLSPGSVGGCAEAKASFGLLAQPQGITATDPITPPARLTIYYSWPSLVNGAEGNVDKAVAAFSPFDIIVLGGVEHPDHPDHDPSAQIIAQLTAAGKEVYGYVDMGVSTENLPVATAEQYVDEWKAMGVTGIFWDDAGYDFGVDRARQNALIDYTHAQGLRVFINAWHPEDVFEPDPDPTHLTAGDLYLAESHPVDDGRFADLDLWWDKSQMLLNYRAQTGVRLAAISTGDDRSSGWANAPVFRQALWAAYLFGFDAFGFTNPEYSASGPSGDHLQPLPHLATNPGSNFVGPPTGPSGDPPTYSRLTDRGTILVWGDATTGGGTFRGGACNTALTGTPLWPTCSHWSPAQSSPFGPRQKASEDYRYDWHRGVDIPQAEGSPVYAIEDGMVRIAGSDPGYSDPLVQLRHGSSAPYRYSNYMHMATVAVAPGDLVTAGDLLGTSGHSDSGFEHLHFEIRDGGLYQEYNRNPWGYLPYTDTTPALPTLLGINQDMGGKIVSLEGDTPADELDLDGVELYWGQPITLSFEALNASLTHTDPAYPDGLDTPLVHLEGGVDVCIQPDAFNTASSVARYTFTFFGLDPAVSSGSAALRDLHRSGPALLLNPPLPSLTLSPATQSAQVVAGRARVFTHTLRNDTSHSLALTLQGQSAQHSALTVQPDSLTLVPGASTTVTVTVRPLSTLAVGGADCLLLRVLAGDPALDVVAVDTFTITAPCYDVTGDDVVDEADLSALAAHWRRRTGSPGWDDTFDLNGDGAVDVLDLLVAARHLGEHCSHP